MEGPRTDELLNDVGRGLRRDDVADAVVEDGLLFRDG